MVDIIHFYKLSISSFVNPVNCIISETETFAFFIILPA